MKLNFIFIATLFFATLCFMSCKENYSNSMLIEAREKVIVNQSESFYINKAREYVRNEGESSWNAIANFEKAIEINPSKAGYYNDLANCYRGGIKDFKKALEYYNKAIEKGLNKGFVFYNRAICKLEINDLSGACSDNQTAISYGWHDDYYDIITKAKCVNRPNLIVEEKTKIDLNREEISSNSSLPYAEGSKTIPLNDHPALQLNELEIRELKKILFIFKKK